MNKYYFITIFDYQVWKFLIDRCDSDDFEIINISNLFIYQ